MGRNSLGRLLIVALVLGALAIGCSSSGIEAPCDPMASVDVSGIEPGSKDLIFGFPLDGLPDLVHPVMTRFCENAEDGHGGYGGKVHAAEDYERPPGTPVYAVADGRVSFSGEMGGYGWLVIVDHPDLNLYSLYGHLSPSRPTASVGAVATGDIIGYLGDDNENGGTDDNPLIPHLHFSFRAGQRSDYPGHGDWRWMAGWIEADPSELGWIQPSGLIASQSVPDGGFRAPASSVLGKWGPDLALLGIFVVGIVSVIVAAIVKRSPLFLVLYGAGLLVAMYVGGSRGPDTPILVLRVIGTALLCAGVIFAVRRRSTNHRS